jgi:hypothetical protein
MNFKFARTRHHYDSYQDFWKMVELAGLPTCFVDEIDINSDTIYVTTPITGELKSRQLPKARRAKIVWWNLERPDGEYAGNFNEVITEAFTHVDEIWVADRYYQTLDTRMKFVVMGSHPGLLIPASETRAHDITHYSYVNGRRNHIYGRLHQLGLDLAPNSWGSERAGGLLRSKLFLNVHQTDALIGEPLRFAVGAAFSTLFVSEHCADPFPLIPGVDFLSIGYHDIAEFCQQAVQGHIPCNVDQMRHSFFNRLCIEHQFPNGALQALKEIR